MRELMLNLSLEQWMMIWDWDLIFVRELKERKNENIRKLGSAPRGSQRVEAPNTHQKLSWEGMELKMILKKMKSYLKNYLMSFWMGLSKRLMFSFA